MMQFLRGITVALAAMACAGCAGIQEKREQKLTVLTYNIHHGTGTDGRLDLERIAAIIRSSQADLVALQEVDQNTARVGGIDEAAELGRLTGLHHVFGKAMDFQGGAYGQAILSRWPIQSHEVHQLPQRDGREPRILLRANLGRAMNNLVFAGTHLDHQIEEIRVEQAAAIRGIFRTNEANPVILGGGFNAVAESGTMRGFWTDWMDAAGPVASPTIPAGKPSRRIDFILLRPRERWTVESCEVLNEPVASDHRPVLAVLRYGGEEPWQ